MEIFEHNQVALLAFLVLLVAVIFRVAQWPGLRRFFRYCPPLIWCYFVPMFLSTAGFIPHKSPLYGDFMLDVLLPFVIVMLLVPTDTASISRVGGKAIALMLVGTAGIVAGAAGSTTLFVTLLPEGTFPPDLWKGIAALSGSWIGGSTNMAAIAGSLNLDSALLGKMIVVDTVCAYTWLGMLIALVAWQTPIDRWNRADANLVHDLSARLAWQQAERARPITMPDVILMLALGLVVSQICLDFGSGIAEWIDHAEAAGGLMATLNISQVLSGFGWGMLAITFVSIALSFTPLRRIEDAGATAIGNAGLYLLLTSFGAQADLRYIGAGDLWLFAIGAAWLLIHIAILFVGARLLRAPLFLIASASMANVGGTASAPVVAGAFHPSLAPVGLLLAILGGLLGTPVGLLVVGKICALITGA